MVMTLLEIVISQDLLIVVGNLFMDVLQIKYMTEGLPEEPDVGSNNCVSVPGFLGYYITRDGRVISTKSGTAKVLKPTLTSWRYHKVDLSNTRAGRRGATVHRLVAQAYLPNYSEDLEVDHIDGNKINNNLNNLRMCDRDTNSRNRQDYLGGIEFTKTKYVCACWREGVKEAKTKYFRIDIYGFAFAFLMATNLREEMVKLYYNRVE
jgi:hypothetical protein